jgi:lysophospholipase L1-like esterase
MKLDWAIILIFIGAYETACDQAPATIIIERVSDESGAAADGDADADLAADAGVAPDATADAEAAMTTDADATVGPTADAGADAAMDATVDADATGPGTDATGPGTDASLDAEPTPTNDSGALDASTDATAPPDGAGDGPPATQDGGDDEADADGAPPPASEAGPTGVVPVLPADMTVFIDGSRASSFSLSGFLAADTSLVDTSTTLIQVMPQLQPTYDRYICGGGPGLLFGGSGAPGFVQPSYLGMPAFAMAIPFSLVVLARSDGPATLAEVSPNIAINDGVLISSTTGPTVQIRGPVETQTADAVAGPAWDTDNTARALILTYDGTAGGVVLTADGVPVPLAFGGTASGTGLFSATGTVGATHTGASALTGSEAFLGIVPGRVIGAAEAASILAYLDQFWALPPPSPPTRNTIAIGDSLVIGFLTQPTGNAAYGFYQRAIDILGPRFGPPHNFGVGGADLTAGVFSVLNQWTESGAAALVAGMPNIVVVEGGINDVAVAAPTTASAATAAGFATVASMKTVVTQVASDMATLAGGPHTIEVQTITLPATDGPQQMARRVANSVIAANYASWGNANVRVRLVDVAADPALSQGSQTNLAPYYDLDDSTHPAKPGQERWGALLARDILAAGL